jgi:hypothetical protein
LLITICRYRCTVARVAEGLGVSWNTANDAVLAEGRRVLIKDPHQFDGVRMIGVDEHCWRHTRRGDKYGTSNGPTEATNGRLEHLRAQPSASATSPTTSPDRFWRPAGSGPNYTLDHEEP